jgi:hypothetical protein
MKINTIIDRVDTLRPNQFTREQKIAWLTELDSLIWDQVYLTHVLPAGASYAPYAPDVDGETELLAPAPYDGLYEHYLNAQMDLGNAELGKYNNDSEMFNAAYARYRGWWHENHKPVSKYPSFNFGQF